MRTRFFHIAVDSMARAKELFVSDLQIAGIDITDWMPADKSYTGFVKDEPIDIVWIGAMQGQSGQHVNLCFEGDIKTEDFQHVVEVFPTTPYIKFEEHE